jgi:hypothetical protein
VVLIGDRSDAVGTRSLTSDVSGPSSSDSTRSRLRPRLVRALKNHASNADNKYRRKRDHPQNSDQDQQEHIPLRGSIHISLFTPETAKSDHPLRRIRLLIANITPQTV